MKKRIVSVLIVLILVLTSFGMTSEAKSDSFQTTVTKIVNQQVKSKDSKKTKMEKLFKYAEKTYGYKRVKNFSADTGWAKKYAQEMYKNKKGSCYHDAAAYAFLVKKATGYTVRVGVGKTNGFNKKVLQAHAWVEVKVGSTWYICDTNLDRNVAKSKLKYFYKSRNTLKKTYNNFKDVKYFTISL
jgi:hypothetical protein